MVWPYEYAKIIYQQAIKKKFKFETFRMHLYESYAIGRIEALESILNYIEKYPNDDREIIMGELHLAITDSMKQLNRRSKLKLKVSLEETLKRQGLYDNDSGDSSTSNN